VSKVDTISKRVLARASAAAANTATAEAKRVTDAEAKRVTDAKAKRATDAAKAKQKAQVSITAEAKLRVDADKATEIEDSRTDPVDAERATNVANAIRVARRAAALEKLAVDTETREEIAAEEEEAAADALQKKVDVVAKRIVACQCITDVHVICVQRKRCFVQEDDLEAPNTDYIHPRALRSALNREMALNAALSKKLKYYELQLNESERNREKDKSDDRLHAAKLLVNMLL